MTNISIPPEEMQAIVGKAILDSLTEDARNTIIESAITWLNKVPTDTYGRSKGDTPLVTAFTQAVATIAQKAAREIVEEHALPGLKAEWAEMLSAAPEEWDISEQTKVAVMGLIFDDMRQKARR